MLLCRFFDMHSVVLHDKGDASWTHKRCSEWNARVAIAVCNARINKGHFVANRFIGFFVLFAATCVCVCFPFIRAFLISFAKAIFSVLFRFYRYKQNKNLNLSLSIFSNLFSRKFDPEFIIDFFLDFINIKTLSLLIFVVAVCTNGI